MDDLLSGVNFLSRKCVKSTANFVASPRDSPSPSNASFMREIQNSSNNFTHLSSVNRTTDGPSLSAIPQVYTPIHQRSERVANTFCCPLERALRIMPPCPWPPSILGPRSGALKLTMLKEKSFHQLTYVAIFWRAIMLTKSPPSDGVSCQQI